MRIQTALGVDLWVLLALGALVFAATIALLYAFLIECNTVIARSRDRWLDTPATTDELKKMNAPESEFEPWERT